MTLKITQNLHILVTFVIHKVKLAPSDTYAWQMSFCLREAKKLHEKGETKKWTSLVCKLAVVVSAKPGNT